MILSSLVKNPVKTYYDGVDKDENIKYVLRKSLLTTIPWILLSSVMSVAPFFFVPLLSNITAQGQEVVNKAFLAVVVLAWYIATFGFFYQNFLNWFFNVFIITNKKIVDVDFHGIAYKNISETTLNNVEDVTSTVKSVVGVIFNVGNVFIQTAGEKREFEFSEVDNPSKIRDLISDLVANKKRHGNN